MAQLQPEVTLAPDGASAPIPFERALDELETIVAQMEDGTLSLDQSLAAYKRGAELVKVCETALERAKEQVRVLDGELLRPIGEVRNGERG
jgi:exodeoxyribonuclease VII small subunit